MNITVQKEDLTSIPCDVLIVNRFQDQKELAGATKIIDDVLEGLLSNAVKEDGFAGTRGSTLMLRTQGQIGAKRVLLVGLGKEEDFCEEVVRSVSASALGALSSMKLKHVVSILHGAGNGGLSPRQSAKAIVEGVTLGTYTFSTYKKAKGNVPQQFTLVCKTARSAKAADQGRERGALFAEGTILARDLVNTPAQDMTPAHLVDVAKGIAKGKKNLKVKVLDKEKLQKMGAGGILGVSQGSDQDPYLIHLTYTPAKPSKKKIFLVGKAVTFDTGGLSLKPSKGMETMKCDMAGSAAVLGVFSVIADLAPDVEVHGVLGAVENAISAKAIRPGDIISVLNKKTVEVLNTDAEGRLTLADTLAYSAKQKPTVIIDMATLTGACVVALGEEITALMSNSDEWADNVLEASNAAGEKMWRMPLEQNYAKLMESKIADYRNISTSRYGGSITAGLFLQPFVGDTPWVHLDIAGPAFAERPLNTYTKHGGSGHAVRTLLTLIK